MAETPRLTRVPNWRPVLTQYIMAMQHTKFDWDPSQPNTINCLTYMCNAIRAQTGRDVYGEVAKLTKLGYTSRDAAYQAIDQIFGSDDIEGVLDQFFESKSIVSAVIGDVGIAEVNGIKACAVVMNPLAYVKTLTGEFLNISPLQLIKVYDPLSFAIPDKYLLTHLPPAGNA